MIITPRHHQPNTTSSSPRPRSLKKQVRIVKKVRTEAGVWRFISLEKVGDRYVWDKQKGYYFVEWWEGRKRFRQMAGTTPSQAVEAQRRKRNELIGELALAGRQFAQNQEEVRATRVPEAIEFFKTHIRTHSPAKPRTLERYNEVLAHFERLIGGRKVCRGCRPV